MPKRFFVVDAAAWSGVAKAILPDLLATRGWVALAGPLGAGKTTLVKAIVSELESRQNATGVSGRAEVTSPTFDVCHVYATEPPVVHYDLFRIEPTDARALADIDWDPDLQNGAVVLVEWADRFPFAGDPPEWVARFSIDSGDEGGRTLLWERYR